MSVISPRVTVIIPTYNRAPLLPRSIKSVLAQTYQDFELIVVDDASTDNTESVVSSLNDKRLRYIRLDKNSGSPATPTNTGIKIANGEYIAIQDSDDEWLPSKLEKQMKAIQNTSPDVGVIYTDMCRITEDGKRTYFPASKIMPEDGIVYEDALSYKLSNIGTPTLLIRKRCFDRAGFFDENLPHLIETELLIRMSRYYYFYHINEPLVNFFVTPGSIVSNPNARIAATKLVLAKFYLDIKANRKILAKHYALIGHLECANGAPEQGRKYLMKAMVTYPLRAYLILPILISFFGRRSYVIASESYSMIWNWGRRDT